VRNKLGKKEGKSGPATSNGSSAKKNRPKKRNRGPYRCGKRKVHERGGKQSWEGGRKQKNGAWDGPTLTKQKIAKKTRSKKI